MKALIDHVEEEPSGTAFAAAALLGDTVLALEEVSDFTEKAYGAAYLQVDATVYEVLEVDDDLETVTIASGLEAAAAAGDPVLPVDALGEQVTRWTIWLDDGGGGVQPAVPVHPLVPLVSSTAEALPGTAVIYHREGDDLYVDSLVDKEPDHDGEKLVTATVSSDALTTSAAGDDVVNGTFEDWTPLGYAAQFDAWHVSWGLGTGAIGDSIVSVVQGGDQIAGTVSATIANAHDAIGLRHSTDRIYPVHGGQVIEVSVSMRANRLVDRSAMTDPTLVDVIVHSSDGSVDPEALFEPASSWQEAVVLGTIDTNVKTYTGQVTIPPNDTQMRISVGAHPSGDGSGWSLVYDEVHKRVAADVSVPQRADTLSVGTLQVDSIDDILIGGQPLSAWLAANYTPLASAPTVSTFTATGIRSYDAGGTLAVYDLSTGTVITSYGALGYNSTWGNRDCYIDFDATSIAATLAGKTISKVEAYLFCTLRGDDTTSGIIPIGFHSSSTPQANRSAVTGRDPNKVRPGGWKQGVGKWVDITQSVGDWQTGVKKGIMLGQGQTVGGTLSNSLTYSNRVAGLGTSTPPKLRFTYT